MLLLTTLSMVRPNPVDNKDSLPAHYIEKRAISEGYTNAGYTLEGTTTSDGITTPKHITTEKPISHDQNISCTMPTGLGITGGVIAGVTIGAVGIALYYRAYENSNSKENEHVDYPIVSPIDMPSTSQNVLEEIQDVTLAGNTTTQVEQ